mgnify:FL=1
MKQEEIKISSNKSFGIVFFVIFIVIALWPLMKGGDLKIWSIIIAIIFLFLGLINSKILTPLNKLWFRFGVLLGKIVAPIVMGIIYFVLVTPIGVIMKIFKKDILNLKIDKNKKTYWLKKDENKQNMKNQF